MTLKEEAPRVKENLDAIEAEIFGNRRKVLRSSPKDIVGNKIILPFADAEFTAAIVFGTVCKVQDFRQAITEYARVIRKGSPVAFNCWAKSGFDKQGEQYYVPETLFRTWLGKYVVLSTRTLIYADSNRKLVVYKGSMR